MARKAAVISIDVNAGTAKMLVDLEKGKAGLHAFGAAGQGSARQAALEMKILEGNIGNNTRAVSQLLVNTLGLGKVVQGAFAAFTVTAAIGMVATLATKVGDFFKEIQQAPAKIGGAFRALNEPLSLTNDELQVTNDRLANDIAKLEGKRQNSLKLALDEARISADKLADSLEKDLSNLAKLLKEENVGILKRLAGEAGADDLESEFGGKTGHEGFIGKVEGITDEGNQKIREATDAKAKDAAQTELNTRLLAAYRDEIAKVNGMLATSERDQRIHQGSSTLADRTAFRKDHNIDPYDALADPQNIARDQSARIPALRGIVRQLGYESDSVSLQGTNTALTGRKDALTTANENAQRDKPFEDRMKALGVQLDGVKAKLAAIGQPEAAQTIAKAFGEAQKAIEEVNKALEKQHTKLTDAQKAQITAVEQAIASAEAEATWKAQLESTTTATNDRIRSQELLTAAIGKGYEATRNANVETQVMGAMKEHYADPAFAGDAAKLRAGYGAAYDASHSDQTAGAVEKLGEQSALEKQSAAVQAQGAEAVRQATLAHKIKQIAEDNDAASAKVLIQAEIDLYNATRANLDAETLAKLNERIAATQRLTAAVFSGAEAQRKAANESKYAEMAHGRASADEVSAQRALDEAERQHAVTEEAGKLVTVYSDQVEHLNQIEEALEKQKKDHGDTLEIEIALRDLENERLKIAVQQELKLKGARDGLKAFFLEMQEDAKSAANIVYDSLNSALDKVSDQFAKLFTGQKTSFGKMFQGIGQDMVKESVKSAMQKGLGELGKKVFHVGAPAGKADGSDAHPFYVIVKGKSSSGAGSPTGGETAGDDSTPDSGKSPFAALGGLVKSGAGALAGLLGKLFSGGGGSGESVSSSISYGGAMAEGGDVDPGHGYIVGDGGEPEFFRPRTAGTITPAHKIGGGSYTYHIDARGADLGAANRTARAIEAAHNAAVRNSVKAQAERTKRTPQRAGR
jgi:hypothetical protein